MAKSADDSIMDAALAVIATGDTITVCSAQPTTYAEATSTYKLADGTLTPGDGNGDFTIANGDTSGRKVTISQQNDLDVDATNTATHVAICVSGTSTLLLVTTCTSQVLTSGGTVTVPAFKDEIADPS